jgi:hypothetical protein
LESLAGLDLDEKREKALAALAEKQKQADEDGNATEEIPEETANKTVTVKKTIITKKTIIVTTTSSGESRTVVREVPPVEAASEEAKPAEQEPEPVPEPVEDDGDEDYQDVGPDGDDDGDDGDDGDGDGGEVGEESGSMGRVEPPHSPIPDNWSSPESVFLGLRVYTHKDSPVVIGGQLGTSFPGL